MVDYLWFTPLPYTYTSQASCSVIHKLIDDALASGITSDKIVLGGFSQGGAMALLASYTCPHHLGGCVCFSGWPALSGADGALRAQLKRGKYATTPALVCHGTADGVVLPGDRIFPSRFKTQILNMMQHIPQIQNADSPCATDRPSHRPFSLYLYTSADSLFLLFFLLFFLAECGEAVKDLLEEADVPVVYKTYPMAHSTHPQQMGELDAFLKKVFGE